MTGMLADGTFRFHDDSGADLGTFAERAVISQSSCVPVEADIPFEAAALNQGYQDLDDGRLIRGVTLHP
jgi:Zn-dependent alcohol dehydrogenase